MKESKTDNLSYNNILYRPVALMASGTTAIACILIIIQSVMDANKPESHAKEFNETYSKLI